MASKAMKVKIAPVRLENAGAVAQQVLCEKSDNLPVTKGELIEILGKLATVPPAQ